MESIELFRRLDKRDDQNVGDPARVDQVVEEIRRSLTADLAVPSTVAGWRAQALFASLVGALDGCELMTLVDSGEIYFDGDSVKAPDYFLRLRDGRKLLVDVKSISIDRKLNLKQVIKFGSNEVARMKRFASLFEAELYLAIYVEGIHVWLFLPIGALSDGEGGGYRIALEDGFLQNDLAILGDHIVGVSSPLEMHVFPDSSVPNEIVNGSASFQIGAVKFYSGGKEVTSETGRKIVLFLMMYGGWEPQEQVNSEGGKISRVIWTANPVESTPGENFETVGHLSSMYSRLFELDSSGPTGPTSLDIDIDPGSLATLIPHDYESDDLPLWRFYAAPKTPG